MKNHLLIIALGIALASSVTAQKIEKPTLTTQPPTTAQSAAIHEGVRLADARDFDGAIAKYEAVIKENPDCAVAKYELAFALYNKGNRVRAEAVARNGARYRSDELPMFYTVLGNILDDGGKSAEAIELYQRSIDLLKKDPNRRRDLAEAEYNLGYTYVRQKQLPDARASLKEAVGTDFSHRSANLLLALIYKNTGYKMPALLAATRYLGLDRDTPQAKQAAAVFLEILKPAGKDPQTGNINIFINTDAPKDEGNFGAFELFLGTATMAVGDDDKGKSDTQLFAEGVSSIFAITVESKDLKNFFVGKYYVPYLQSMKAGGHQEAFAYLVLQQGGNADAAKWVASNPDKVAAYYSWAKSYQPAGQ
jgi:tetratricopeptide (TPR) repeat protein